MGNGKILRASALQIVIAILLALLLGVGGIYATITAKNGEKLECAEKDILTLKQDVDYVKKDYTSLRDEILPELKSIKNDMTEIQKSIAVLEKGK